MTKHAPPAFASVTTDTLPEPARKGPNPETLAIGRALLDAITPGNAALDPGIYATRKDAMQRAATLKRAASAVDPSRHLRARIYAEGDEFRVAIMDAPPPAA